MLQLKVSSRLIFLFVLYFFLSSCVISDKHQLNKTIESARVVFKDLSKKPLTEKDIAAGLKEALKIGSARVVSKIGKRNGYLNDTAIHIVLPKNLQKAHEILDKLGLGRYTKELERKMNRAAELAAPAAKKIFIIAIKDMRWHDVKAIYNGKQDAATQYFKNKMTPSLKKRMRPLIEKTLAEAGVIKAYKHVVNQYHSIPFVPRVKNDLTGYVMNKGINGLFYYLAIEEAAIRKNPEKRTTKLLRRIFNK